VALAENATPLLPDRLNQCPNRSGKMRTLNQLRSGCPSNRVRPNDPFVAAVLKVAKPRPHWPKDYVRNLDQHLYGVSKSS
jgi:hypothetical protein